MKKSYITLFFFYQNLFSSSQIKLTQKQELKSGQIYELTNRLSLLDMKNFIENSYNPDGSFSLIEGAPRLIEFFSDNCPTCMKAQPEIQKLA